MDEHEMGLVERQMLQADNVRTLTIVRPESTFLQTLTLGNGAGSSTDVPVPAMPSSDSSNRSDNVAAILSGVIVFVVLLVVIWLLCRKGRKHSHSRDSSRANRSSSSSSTSEGSESSGGPSDNGSVVSEVGDGQWEPPGRPMPGMPPMGRWGGPPGQHMPPPGVNMGAPGVGMGPPGVGMGMPFGRGGPSPTMGRGTGPLPNYGGPPGMVQMTGSGGPPPMPQ
ncbi:hypothetical protein F5Y08DRAFT_335582 [Xylaria arbuscula]|nr:hypothetical protein F5Y08DRAFT_335582 [Xylaria arbuscula]